MRLGPPPDRADMDDRPSLGRSFYTFSGQPSHLAGRKVSALIHTNLTVTLASSSKMNALLAAKLRHGLLVGSSALLPLLLGLPILLLQARQELDAEAVLVHELVDKRVASIMDDASAAVRSVASMIDAPCATASFNLRLGVQAYPFVRSLILAKNGRIYCSSLDGSVDHDEEVDKYIDGRLRLMPGNTVTPGRAFLVYREVVKSGSVLAGIDGQHIFDALSLDATEFTVQIGVGGSWVGVTGVVNQAVLSSGKSVLTHVKSNTYPFTIAVAYDEASVWRKLANDYWPSWILLTLLGTILGYASHRFAARRHSPTGELRRAVAADEFVPFYQPIVRGLSGEITGA